FTTHAVCISQLRPPPRARLFPYTTLFRSSVGAPGEGVPEHKFRTEVLCQWVTASREPTFPEWAVEACIDNDSQIAEDSPLYLAVDRKSTRLNSSHVKISYAVFCLKKKKKY